MPISYRIIPAAGLVYVRYSGQVDFSETGTVFAAYLRDPDYRPGQKQLIDFSAVTGFSQDFTAMMSMQAQKTDAFVMPDIETLLVYYAPTEATQRIARFAMRGWDHVPGVIARVLTEPAALHAFLGLSESDVAGLLESATP